MLTLFIDSAMGTRKPSYLNSGPHQRKPDLKQQSINTMLNRQKIAAINNSGPSTSSSQKVVSNEENKDNRPASPQNKENRPTSNMNPFASPRNKENRPALFASKENAPKITKKRKTSDVEVQNSKKVMVDKENVAVKQEPVETSSLTKAKVKPAQPSASTSKGKEPLGNISNTVIQPHTAHKHQSETCVSCANVTIYSIFI